MVSILNDEMKPKEQECELLGTVSPTHSFATKTSKFSLFIQACLASLALTALIFKWQYEAHKRHYVTWLLDVSKQVIGAFALHFGNIAIAKVATRIGAHSSPAANQCVWYFLNVLTDTVIGVPLIYLFLRLLHRLCIAMSVTGTRTGEYGRDPLHPDMTAWTKQVVLYLTAMFLAKVIGLLIVSIPYLDDFAAMLLSPIRSTKGLIFFVMFLFPLAANIVQVLITDQIIYKKESSIKL